MAICTATVLAGCGGGDSAGPSTVPSTQAPTPTTTDDVAELASPAAQFCVDQGGTVFGPEPICGLPDGRAIDAWEFFRTETSGSSTAMPSTTATTASTPTTSAAPSTTTPPTVEDELLEWLGSDMATGPSLDPVVGSTGHACFDSSPRMGLDLQATCLRTDGDTGPTCAAADGLASALRGPGWSTWVTAADELLRTTSEQPVETQAILFLYSDGVWGLVDSSAGTLLAESAASIRDILGHGLQNSGVGDSLALTLERDFEVACGIGLAIPVVLRQELSGDEELLAAIGDDPIFLDLPLRLGDSGEPVRVVQELIIRTGGSVGRYGADGDFGDDTKFAIENFQYQVGHDITGVVSPATLAALRREAAIAAEPGSVRPSCDIAADIELSQLNVGGSPLSVSEVSCARMPFDVLIALYLAADASGSSWILASEGHVAWNAFGSYATRSDACGAAPEFIAVFDADAPTALAQLGVIRPVARPKSDTEYHRVGVQFPKSYYEHHKALADAAGVTFTEYLQQALFLREKVGEGATLMVDGRELADADITNTVALVRYSVESWLHQLVAQKKKAGGPDAAVATEADMLSNLVSEDGASAITVKDLKAGLNALQDMSERPQVDDAALRNAEQIRRFLRQLDDHLIANAGGRVHLLSFFESSQVQTLHEEW
ncbi:vgrG3, partial [Symbiodinium sp. KB8]